MAAAGCSPVAAAEARPPCGLYVPSARVGVAGSSQTPGAHPARAPGPRSPGGGVILTWRTHPPRVPAWRSRFPCLEKAEAQRGRESPRDQPARTWWSQAGALAPRAAGEGHSGAEGEARSLSARLARPVCSMPLWPSRAIFGAGAGLPGPHPRPRRRIQRRDLHGTLQQICNSSRPGELKGAGRAPKNTSYVFPETSLESRGDLRSSPEHTSINKWPALDSFLL